MSLCIVKKEQNNSQSTICTDKMIKVTEDNENGVYILIITNITQMVRYSQVVGNQYLILQIIQLVVIYRWYTNVY
jgi:hypothetical protein